MTSAEDMNISGDNTPQTYTLWLGNIGSSKCVKVCLIPGWIRSKVIVYWPWLEREPSVFKCWVWEGDETQAEVIARLKSEVQP